MALVECPECKKEISSLATACPHCGMPIQRGIADTATETPEIGTIQKNANRRKGVQLASGICVVLFMMFGTWFYFAPYLAVYGMKSALEARDAAKLSSYVSFPLLKESLKANVNAMLASEVIKKKEADPFGALGTALAAVIINPMIDAFVTPENLAMLMKGYEPLFGEKSNQLPLGRENARRTDSDAGVDMSMSYESFDRFVVTVKKKSEVGEPVGFIFNRGGMFSWKLSALRLPTEDRGNKYWQEIGEGLKPTVTITDSVQAYYLENVHSGQVLVIEGEVLNESNQPVSLVLIEGKLFDSRDAVAQTQRCYAGNSFTRKEIGNLTPYEIKGKMMNIEGENRKNVRIPPAGKVPFMLVFDNLREIITLSNYSVNVISSKLDSGPNLTQEPTVNKGGAEQPETSKGKEENQMQSAAVQPEPSRPSLPPAHEQMPETQSESREQTEPLELVYPGPMADFFIADGDIEKNTEPFVSSGSFSVELHSVYKGQARTSMIDNIKRMLSSGEMTASQESGNPDLLGHIITAANFDTRKKTVTFSGRQIYLDMNNATIGTTRVQQVYQYDTPKYFTLGKVAGAIESMLQGAVSGEAYSNPLKEENTTKRETAPARDYKSVLSRLRGETPSANDQQRVQTGDSFLNNIARVNTDYMAKHPREFVIVDGTYESKKGRLKLKELEPGNDRVSVDLEVANGLGMGELHGIGSLSGRTIKSIRTEEREPCDITISLTGDFGNTASVVENGCSYYHGVSCDFSGKFTRKQIGKQNFDPYSVRRIE